MAGPPSAAWIGGKNADGKIEAAKRETGGGRGPGNWHLWTIEKQIEFLSCFTTVSASVMVPSVFG